MGEGGLLLLLLALLAGLVALVVSVIAMFFKIVGAACSGVLNMLGIGSRRSDRGVRMCDNPQCRRPEVRAARYCSRCGHALA